MSLRKANFPMQPIYDANGTLRFKSNAIITWWLDNGSIDLNEVVAEFYENNKTDLQQFAQLIDYSVDGFFELGYATENTLNNINDIIDREEYGVQNFKLPFQPLLKDESGIVRFKSNAVVDYFFMRNSITLLDIVKMQDNFSNEDFEQLYMLLGYSVDGFAGQIKVRDNTIRKVDILVARNFTF